ncbi:MAG: hydantoinase/oxoprolinase family protein [Hyphomicrobiales bacterium]|nr:hydantoinase/oxoprolinase family protein [Hyphomicrobiales bacterium]
MSDHGAAARIGVDVGGTFTDIALETGDCRFTSKLLTTVDDPAEACMRGLEDVLHKAGLEPGAVGVIIHGTTLATNAIIERKGAITSLVTTQGFRDTIEIGTEGRPEQYDLNIIQPAPLVPRRRRFAVEERLNSRGEVLVPLTTEALEALLPALDAAGTESLAIAFIHGYANPVHEHLARDFFAARRPAWSITVSADVSPEFREFERFSTACANAYVRPLIERYLGNFETRLKARGFTCPLQLMLSSGGLTTIETARQFPVRLVESGPAGGAIFAREIAGAHGIDKALSFDMGGTTAKICLVDDGRAQTSRRFEVARVYRFRKDSGIPLRIPVIEMVEIGAGGGSIAWIDELGRITVGPQSAGSSPGPACYDLGGEKPTVTDANVEMGRIDPSGFAGGRMPLAADKATAALNADIGSPMAMSPMAAAFGLTEIVCENMATAARVHAIESGKNVDDRTLIAFGGAAPLHACQMAEKLGIRRIIVPRHAGVGSAVGFLRAPVSYEVVRTLYQRMDAFDAEVVNAVYEDMEAEAAGYVRQGAGDTASLSVRRQAYMRYQGQGHEIAVDIPNETFGDDGGQVFQSLFDRGYEAAFGRAIGAIAAAEVVAWSVTVSTGSHADLETAIEASGPANGASGHRPVFDPGAQSAIDYAIHHRDDLGPGASIEGPAVITEEETSTVVDSRFQATILPGGEIELNRRALA